MINLRFGRYYGNLILQLCSFMLLILYTYLTYLTEPFNLYGIIAAVVLFVNGYFRPLHEALIASMVFILAYGGWVVYRYWFGAPLFEIGWNELVWLLLFPYFALIGGINRSNGTAADADPLSFLYAPQQEQNASNQLLVVEERLAFMSSTAFLYQLEENVLDGLRENKAFHLLLVQIENLDKFTRFIGRDHAQVMLNMVAESLSKLCEGAKAQVGNQVLGGIALTAEFQDVVAIQRELETQFHELLLTRPRRETQVKLNLKFGVASCPTDGIEASALLDKAKHDLIWGGFESKEDEFR